MPDQALPLRRHLAANAVVLTPSYVALAALHWHGELALGPALVAAAGLTVVSVILVQRYLGSLARFARFVSELSGEHEPVMPRLRFAPATEELAAAAATLASGWRRQRASIDNLAASAQAIVDGLPDPLIAVDRQRRVVRTNRAALALLGQIAADRDLSAVLRHPALLSAVDSLLTAADGNVAGADQAMVELALPGPPELDMIAHARRLPRPAADGSLALIVLHDTTALRRAERMRADFVANASHELKTPIAGLLGFIETLRGPARDDVQARERFLGIMAEQADRMRRLVDDLLTLSRIEQHEHSRPDAPVDLGRVLAGVQDLLQLKAASRQVAVELSVDPALPRAVGDHDELTIVFQNLIDNAIKYTRPSTTVRVAARPAGEDRVSVAVSDEGEGIPPAHLPRLTERFYRVDNARSRQLGGTGLGLAIVKHVMNRHRGRLDIQSTPGRGSTFTVTLPAATRNP
ncbi:ATP-binding protein [Enhydrobacter sp.]|jgi:two-component system phosphate regulon sensor histidine kinase PhoR|uniref:ATP-binding protein n=1 Tax=Enhydrobacter sp. TaxID=1894999 RepID=UPI0026255892|nr:ATP-binding protein [Enhydrobacter sp.]WIM10831.1 MAG: Phosphate regulon sensor protein PhoR (SphS) [Enhydrobacter sp.]